MRGDESFADDLNVEGGTVSSRVALLLRSAEVKPFLLKICSSSEEHLSLLPSLGLVLRLLSLTLIYGLGQADLWTSKDGSREDGVGLVGDEEHDLELEKLGRGS